MTPDLSFTTVVIVPQEIAKRPRKRENKDTTSAAEAVISSSVATEKSYTGLGKSVGTPLKVFNLYIFGNPKPVGV